MDIYDASKSSLSITLETHTNHWWNIGTISSHTQITLTVPPYFLKMDGTYQLDHGLLGVPLQAHTPQQTSDTIFFWCPRVSWIWNQMLTLHKLGWTCHFSSIIRGTLKHDRFQFTALLISTCFIFWLFVGSLYQQYLQIRYQMKALLLLVLLKLI